MLNSIGYATMTAYKPHEGHMNFLQYCSNLCDRLIVGITTDEVAIRQKRVPLMPFESRKAVIQACRFVNIVVPHHGEPKSQACKKLGASICFTSEEYYGSAEFQELITNAPEIKIIYVPRTMNISSTDVWQRTQHLVLSQLQVLTKGVSGNVLRCGSHVLKPIPFAKQDLLQTYVDNFGFFQRRLDTLAEEMFNTGHIFRLPRQYKHLGEANLFPNIAGINPDREIFANQFFQGKKWNSFENVTVALEKDESEKEEKLYEEQKQFTTVQAFADHVAKERRENVAQTKFIASKYAGITLDRYINQYIHQYIGKEDLFQTIQDISLKVSDIITEINQAGFLHGDIHPGNIIIDPLTKNLTIIDWGWCCSYQFPMTPFERKWLSERLEENWDWLHFLGSVSSLKIVTEK